MKKVLLISAGVFVVILTAIIFYFQAVRADVLAVGDLYEGGVVAYILQPGDPGYSTDSIKGLIAAPSDQGQVIWDDGGRTATGAVASELGTGAANTETIVATFGEGSYAARLCYDLELDGYTDWYMPSIDELDKLYLNKDLIGGFVAGNYGSSTEWDVLPTHAAYHEDFSSGLSGPADKHSAVYVRAVRSFSIDLYAGGSGTEMDPYQIENCNQLQHINNNLAGYFVLNSNIHCAFDTQDLDGALYNLGLGFDPIGDDVTPFTGSLDGGGFVISGLYIFRENEDYVGLFGKSGGTIHDFGLSQVNITGSSYVGALAGFSSGPVARVAAGGILESINDSPANTGGLIGQNNNSLTEAYSEVEVSGYSTVGGLVGLNQGAEAQISDSYSWGSVTATSNFGGFVGVSTSAIINSYSIGAISSGSFNRGGFIGDNDGGTIDDCFWDGDTANIETSDGGTKVTDPEMRTLETFTDAGWDFDSFWAYADDQYPTLLNAAFALDEISVGVGYDYNTLSEALVAADDNYTIWITDAYDNTLETYPVIFPDGVEPLTIDCGESGAIFENAAGMSTDNYFSFGNGYVVDTPDTIQNCEFVNVGIDFYGHAGNLLNNTFRLDAPIGVEVGGGGTSGLVWTTQGWIANSQIANNIIDIYYAGGDGEINDAVVIGGVFGSENYPSYVENNVITYFTAPTEALGEAISIAGGVNTISGNYIKLLDSEGVDCYVWKGIFVTGREDSENSSHNIITHNTVDIGTSCGVWGGIIYQDGPGAGALGCDVDMTVDINYNLVYGGDEDDSRGITVEKNCVDSSITANVDYNGVYGPVDTFNTGGEDVESLVYNFGENNIENINPLFQTVLGMGGIIRADDVEKLSPVSRYLDINGDEDIGAYSGARRSTAYIDDDAIVDYITVDSNSTDIIQWLRSGDAVNIAAGTYPDGIILNSQNNMIITGSGSDTIIDAPDSANAVYVNNSNDNSISDLTAQGASYQRTVYRTSLSTFVYNSEEFNQLGYIDFNLSNDPFVSVSSNNQDITTVINNYPDDGFDLALLIDSEDPDGRVAMMVPASLFSTDNEMATAFELAPELFLYFVNDAITLTDGVYTYDSDLLEGDGVTIKNGTPDPFYINSSSEIRYIYRSALSTFIYDSVEYDYLAYLDNYQEGDPMHSVISNDQDISSVIEHYPNKNFDLALEILPGEGDTLVALFVPGDWQDTKEELENNLQLDPGTVTLLINDILTVSDGEYTFNSDLLDSEGVAIKAGTTDPYYVSRNERHDYSYTAGDSIFIYDGLEFNQDNASIGFWMNGGDHGVLPVTENGQDVSEAMAAWPNENWDLLIYYDASVDTGLSLFFPDHTYSSRQNVIDSLPPMEESDLLAFVEDAITVSDGSYTYHSGAVATEGITIKSGTADPMYIDGEEIYYGGVHFNNATGNVCSNIISTDNNYGVIFNHESDNNSFQGEVSNSIYNDVYSLANFDSYVGNEVRGLTIDNFDNSIASGNNKVDFYLRPLIQVIGTDRNPVQNIEITYSNDTGSRSGATDVDGYLPQDDNSYISVARLASHGNSVDNSYLNIAAAAMEPYLSVVTTRRLSYNDKLMIFNLLDPTENQELPPVTDSGIVVPPKVVPVAPTAASASNITIDTIQWNFNDVADNEEGVKLYDENLNLLQTLYSANLTSFSESGLSPNTRYQRSVSAYNSAGESSKVALAPRYTLAAGPSISAGVVTGVSSAKLTVDANSNPVTTEYSIYEATTQKYLQATGQLGNGDAYQSFGTGFVDITGLINGHTYNFFIKARNGDGVVTVLSSAFEIKIEQPAAANIVLSKIVGVNLLQSASAGTGLYVGGVASAGGVVGDFFSVLPIYSKVANGYLAIMLGFLALFVLGLILNSADNQVLSRFRHLKHLPKIFGDLSLRRGEEVFVAIHGEEAQTRGQRYIMHHWWYRYTGMAWFLFVVGVIGKVLVVGLLAVLVYTNIGVHAFSNQTGEAVKNGDVLTYRIDYLNNGRSAASDLIINDAVPTDSTYVAGSLKLNGTTQSDTEDSDKCWFGGNSVHCAVGVVNSNGSGFVEFRATVAGTVGHPVLNMAGATYIGGDTSTTSSNGVSNEISELKPQCSDNVDNDGDGQIDFPADFGCSSANDDTENTDRYIGAGQTVDVTLGEDWSYFNMMATAKVRATVRGESHTVEFTGAQKSASRASLEVRSTPQIISIDQNTQESIDTDGNGFSDLLISLPSVISDGQAIVGLKLKTEIICTDGQSRGCIAGNTCNGSQVCNSHTWGACVTSLNKCSDNSCQVTCPPPVVPVCGDATCNGGETCNSCAADCGVCPVETCGNHVCGLGEDCDSCATDCGVCGGETCGNGTCAGGETCNSCAADCGVCPAAEEPMIGTTEAKIVELEKQIEAATDPVEKLTLQTEKVLKQTEQIILSVVDNEQVEKVDQIVSLPMAVAFTALGAVNVATAVASTASAAVGSLGLLSYLQFVAMQPLLLLMSKKRERWGVVYDAITKRPIPLAIIRVFDKKTGQLRQTRVSDKFGRYQFVVDSGEYYIEVIKDDYHYPSQILFEKQQDEKYFGLYHGGSIVADDKMILNYNIPLDPDRKELSAVSIIKRRSLRKFQLALALIGPIAAVISLIIQPTWWVGGLLIAQIFLTVGFRKAAIPLRLKNWGTIIEATTNRPISQAVVRIFDKQYNKLLETQITDSHGRYGFLVTKNNYYLTVEKVGYVKYVSENIVISSDDGGLIARNVELNKS